MTGLGKAKARTKRAGAETGRLIVNRSLSRMRTNGPIMVVERLSLAIAKNRQSRRDWRSAQEPAMVPHRQGTAEKRAAMTIADEP
jgi:hypothetical protein